MLSSKKSMNCRMRPCEGTCYARPTNIAKSHVRLQPIESARREVVLACERSSTTLSPGDLEHVVACIAGGIDTLLTRDRAFRLAIAQPPGLETISVIHPREAARRIFDASQPALYESARSSTPVTRRVLKAGELERFIPDFINTAAGETKAEFEALISKTATPGWKRRFVLGRTNSPGSCGAEREDRTQVELGMVRVTRAHLALSALRTILGELYARPEQTSLTCYVSDPKDDPTDSTCAFRRRLR